MRQIFLDPQRLAIGLFLIALGLPLATALPALFTGGGDDIAAREQRIKAPWPAAPRDLPALRSWPGRFSAWFDDRFGLRDALIDVHNYGKAALGVSPNPKVVIGREGWLFIASAHITDANRGARPFAEGEADRLAAHFVAIQERLAQRSIAYVHLTPPDKQSLFRQYLPRRIRYVGPSRYAQWRRAVAESRLQFVDVYPLLEAALAAGENPYMQTDSHWNCRGAFIAYRAVLAHINRHRTGELPVLTEEDVAFEQRTNPEGGDLARNSLGTPYLFPDSNAMRCRIGAGKANATYTALETGEPLRLNETYVAARPSRVVNHDFPGGPRALVFRDSYTNAMIPFLNHSFGEVIYVAHEVAPPDEALIDEVDPDIVIFEHIERTLARFGGVIAADGLPLSEVRVPPDP